MATKKTEELLNEIQFARRVEDFIKKAEFNYSLSEYLTFLLEKHGLERKDVVKKAAIDTSFGYQIFTGHRKAKRGKLLQIAFAMQLSLEETNQLLRSADVASLYVKNRRDAIIYYCLENKYDIHKADELLYEYREEPISGD